MTKLAKNKEWFVDLVKKAPVKVKPLYPDSEYDENKITPEFFGKVFDSLSSDT